MYFESIPYTGNTYEVSVIIRSDDGYGSMKIG